MRQLIVYCLVACVAGLLSGCEQSPPESVAVGEPTQTTADVIVWVNGSPITEDDVNRSIAKTFGPGAFANMTDNARKSVVESLILSRAVAQRAEQEIGDVDRATIDAELSSFREQALVKFYLKNHARPQPVTEAMISAYYNEHQDRFGGGSVQVFETIAGPTGQSGTSRARVVDALGAADRREDWAMYADRLRQGGLAVRYSRGELKEGLLDARLVSAAAKLQVGDASPITFVDGVPYVLRIVAEQVKQPRPLPEVRAEIISALLPVQLKGAIEEISDDIMTGVDVRYAADEVK